MSDSEYFGVQPSVDPNAVQKGGDTMTGPLTVSSNVNTSGNVSFTATGQRILGDFTNATPSNRVVFQSSPTNSKTILSAIPSGTGNTTGVNLYNSSDMANASIGQINITATETNLASSATGTGTYLPITLSTGGSQRFWLDPNGDAGLGVTPSKPAGFNKFIALGDNDSGVGQISDGIVAVATNGAERLRFGSSGQWGLNGANYGTTGQTIVNQGSGSAPVWGTLPVAGGGTGATTITGLVKGNGTGAMTAAVGNTDYLPVDDAHATTRVRVSHAGYPLLELYNSSGAADQKYARWAYTTGVYKLEFVNDAYGGVPHTPITFQSDAVAVFENNIGVGTTVSMPSGFMKFVAIGDTDSGIGQHGDGDISIASNNRTHTTFSHNGHIYSDCTGGEIDYFIGPQTNSGYLYGNANEVGLYSGTSGGQITVSKQAGLKYLTLTPGGETSGCNVNIYGYGLFQRGNGASVRTYIQNDNTAATQNKSTGVQFSGTDTAGTLKEAVTIVAAPLDNNYVNSAFSMYLRRSDTVTLAASFQSNQIYWFNQSNSEAYGRPQMTIGGLTGGLLELSDVGGGHGIVYRDQTSNSLIMDGRSANSNVKVMAAGTGAITLSTGGADRLTVLNNGDIDSSVTNGMTVHGTATYVGHRVRNTAASGSNTAYSYVDFVNETDTTTSSIQGTHATDGSSTVALYTQPAGSRSVDRRAAGLTVDGNSNVIIGSGSIFMGNARTINMKDAGGTDRFVMSVGSDNFTNIFNAGGAGVRVLNQAGSAELFRVGPSGQVLVNGDPGTSGQVLKSQGSGSGAVWGADSIDVYTGSDAHNLTYPIGTTVMYDPQGGSTMNATVVLYSNAAASGIPTVTSTAYPISGTWKNRGWGSTGIALAQRIA